MAELENIFDEDNQIDLESRNARPLTADSLLYAVGSSFLIALAVVIVMLGNHYLTTRPWNVGAHTTELAEQFQELLHTNFIPARNIRTLRVEERTNDTGRWAHYTFEIAVPSHIDWSGVESLIREALAQRQISMGEVAYAGPGRKYTLTIDRFEFAEALFRIEPDSVHRDDGVLSPCADAREIVRDTALRLGVSPGALSVEALRTSPTHAGHIARFSAALPESITVDMVYRAVVDALAGQDLWVDTSSDTSQRTLISVHYQDNPCVELLCIPTSHSAPRFPPAGPEEEMAGEEEEQTFPPSEEASTDEMPVLEMDAFLPEAEDAASAPLSAVPADDSDSEETIRLAIILDDGGYGGPETRRILELDNRLTLAILPDTPFARQTAEQAHELGFEIMLHMPMQTSNQNSRPFPGELTLSMERDEIQERTRACIEQFPEAKGVNNHTGAAFTADAERMGWFMELVREHNLYFVDSRTTARSQGYDVAVSLGVPSANRDIFLDNSSDPDEIRKQLDELVALARSRGRAVGIGHFRRNTVSVLTEELPKLETMGITLVPASELVR